MGTSCEPATPPDAPEPMESPAAAPTPEPAPDVTPRAQMPAKAPAPSPRPEAPAAARANTGARTPAQHIPESGRLSVTRAALRDGDDYAIGLELDDAARGTGPRPVKVVDVKGRVLETTARPLPGAGSGLRLEIQRSWLQPGQYLIQVKTAENKPLALRRYFLEVVD
jgi:hypothetical protein